VYERPTYELKDVDSSIRAKVRRGLEVCQVGPIPFQRYAKEGWILEQDTQHRQHRDSRRGRLRWASMVAAAESLEGFEVWGAEVDGKLAATLMFAQVDGCIDLLYQQSLREFLPMRVNNALLFDTTRNLVARTDVRMIHNGLHSLDAPASVDHFKVRMGYTLRPLRQRIVFHPRLAPFFGQGVSSLVGGFADLFPTKEVIRKAEGLTRFYLNGKLPLARQSFPELLETRRDTLCKEVPSSGWFHAEYRLRDGREVLVSPAHPEDLEALVALHLTCFTEKEHAAIALGTPFIRDAFRWFITSLDTHTLVARLDGRIVGYTTLSNRPYRIPLLRACARSVFVGLLRRPSLAMRPEWAERFSPSTHSRPGIGTRAMAQIAFTGIAPELQGAGIGHILKETSIKVCRSWGVRGVLTGVRHDNLRAKALNMRFGFKERPDLSSSQLLSLCLQFEDAPSSPEVSTGAPPSKLPEPSQGLSASAPANAASQGYRPAAVADLEDIVRIHQLAFPDYFMTVLGPGFLRAYYLRVLEYVDHVFWVKEGERGLEGFVCGFRNPAEFYRQLEKRRWRIFLSIFKGVAFRPWIIRRLLASYSKVWRSILEEQPDTCEMSSIAVDPASAGQGTGHELAKVFVDAVRRQASAVILTTDAYGNDSVNRFYQKLGFELVGTCERSKGRMVNQYRMDLAPRTDAADGRQV
jgi:ribosomal protein S18 acetylase RimI-like enzyme